jgi:hypothetical protein
MAAMAMVHTSAMRIVVLGTRVPRNVRNEKNATTVATIRANGTMMSNRPNPQIDLVPDDLAFGNRFEVDQDGCGLLVFGDDAPAIDRIGSQGCGNPNRRFLAGRWT